MCMLALEELGATGNKACSCLQSQLKRLSVLAGNMLVALAACTACCAGLIIALGGSWTSEVTPHCKPLREWQTKLQNLSISASRCLEQLMCQIAFLDVA